MLKVILIILVIIVILGWLGLNLKPSPFPAYPTRTPSSLETVPLPAGLPAPVERFYRTVFGEQVPLIKSVVMTGRAVIKPVMNIPLQARFVFVHDVGHTYRHYFEATFFNLPMMKVNEGIVDGESFFESPTGSIHNDPNTNQGANLALFAEAIWFPSLYVTDPRIHWAPVDDDTALLSVPYLDGEESILVRFNPESGLIDLIEAMRYRNPGDANKILWLPQTAPGQTLPDSKLPATGAITWLDQGKPWAIFTIEDIVYNVDVSEYIRQRGY